MSEEITTVADLLDATRFFYTKKKRRKWGTGRLYYDKEYCVLGAMSAVLTNEKAIQDTSYGVPIQSFKQYDLIKETAAWFGRWLHQKNLTSHRGVWKPVYSFNDNGSRKEILKALREAAKDARNA